MDLPVITWPFEGVTYRQAQEWILHGYVFDDEEHFTDRKGGKHPAKMPGRGYHRKWTPEALRRIVLMGRLRQAGLETPVAARVARELAAQAFPGQGAGVVMLSDDICLTMDLRMILAEADE